VQLRSALDATALGIGMVHQHFMLIPTLTVAQNVCLGLRKSGRFFPDLTGVARELRRIGETYGLIVDPQARVDQLSVAGQQRVEIVKALYRGARILVLDEPTAVLAPQEVAGLFAVLRVLAIDGVGIVFISHKLGEVMAISDRITVLRQGRVVAARPTAETSDRELAGMMIGHELDRPRPQREASPHGAAVLDVRDLTCRDVRKLTRVDGVSLTVGRGEVVGIAGVDGNGQQELAEALVGLQRPAGGSIRIDGRDVTRAPPARRIALGLAHIPEDRQRTALVGDLSIGDNAVMEMVRKPPFSHRGWLMRRAIRRFAAALIADYDVRCIGPDQRVGSLSGGNQQKVVLGRALIRNPSLIVAVQPTRGLDIGATAFVHAELLKQRQNGAGIVLVSTELDEILALADRILVMFGGRVAGELSGAEVTLEKLGLLMTGQAA
jgi:simple sugar transport system ATP-binding protein